MDRNEQIHIEQLVSKLVEGAGDGEAFQALDALLLDRPDLQTFYSRCLSMHMLLSGELADSNGYFPPLLSNGPAEKSAATSAGSDSAARPQNTPASLSQSSDSRWLSGVLAAIALSLLVVVLFRGYEYEKRADHTAAMTTKPNVDWHYDVGDDFVWTEDSQAANLISRLTRTLTPSRLLLPSAGKGH